MTVVAQLDVSYKLIIFKVLFDSESTGKTANVSLFFDFHWYADYVQLNIISNGRTLVCRGFKSIQIDLSWRLVNPLGESGAESVWDRFGLYKA